MQIEIEWKHRNVATGRKGHRFIGTKGSSLLLSELVRVTACRYRNVNAVRQLNDAMPSRFWTV